MKMLKKKESKRDGYNDFCTYERSWWLLKSNNKRLLHKYHVLDTAVGTTGHTGEDAVHKLEETIIWMNRLN